MLDIEEVMLLNSNPNRLFTWSWEEWGEKKVLQSYLGENIF